MATENQELLTLASLLYIREADPLDTISHGQHHMDEAVQLIKPKHFLDADSKQLWRAMVGIHQVGDKLSPARVCRELESMGYDKDNIPSALYAVVYHANRDVAGAWNWRYHAKEMIKESIRVWLSATVDQWGAMLQGCETEAVMESLQEVAIRIGQRDVDYLPRDAEQCIDMLISDLQRREEAGYYGAPYGIALLDEMYPRGLEEGDLCIIAGRPGQGKSAFMQTMVREQARAGRKVLVFSVEMTINTLFRRFLAYESKLKMGDLFGHEAHWKSETATNAANSLRGLRDRIWVLDNENNFSKLCAVIRMYAAQHQIDGVYLDYIGLLHGDKADKRHLELARYTANLKTLAKKLGVFVVVLSQVNRESQFGNSESFSRPKMSQLRESGALEQDADEVIFVYQDKPDTKDNSKCKARPVTIYVEKNRHEEPHRGVKTWFYGATQQFEDSRDQTEKLPENPEDPYNGLDPAAPKSENIGSEEKALLDNPDF